MTLENKYVTMNFFKRIKGWGWGEILTPEGKLMAVMDHLGELMIRDQDIPMRFEADSVSRVRTDDGESLVFNVKSVVVREMLKGTSFDNWMHYPYGRAGHYRNGDDYRHSGFSFRQTEIRSDGDR